MKKESKSSAPTMLNKNWVLKRKRRKLPIGPDQSSGKEQSNGKEDNPVASESSRSASAKRMLKTEEGTAQFSSKKKGHDGYFYECVICDLGGNLLCCDSCPRTYHLQCLDPPLKRIPMGKWQCPSCFEENDQLMPLNNLDSISRRARTKTVPVKSKAGVNPVNLEKVSGIFGNKHISKKRSTKAKSISTMGGKFFGMKPVLSPVDATCSDKPVDPSLESCMEGTSCADADEKNLNLSPTVSPMDRMSVSPDKEALSPSKITNLDANDDLLEEKPDLSCDKIPFRKTLVLAITVGGEEMGKRKHKVIGDNANQKKRRTEKGKKVVITPIKSKSGNNKVQTKQKSKTHKISISASKGDVGKKKSDAQQKDKAAVSFQLGKSKV